MPKPKQITIISTVSRHHPQFSRLVTISLDVVAPWKLSDTTVIEGTINNTELGRRSMKRWDDRNCWWIDLPEPLCQRAKLETGDEVTLKISLASEDLPDELTELLTKSSQAKANWEKLTKAQQRMLREEILAGKSSETRSRRAKKVLLRV
ncbi:MAG TPA: YdeI/OmpD-associated family protein [Pyrinomonadaceae bacterium]|nr:YdeI/OmpD-associated family protein [Pyrinomonadaceae bacterium]